jgi:preprotein translocase subunit YajC
MKPNWIILAVVLVCTIALIVFLIIRNQKDKQDGVDFSNTETEIEDESEPNKDIDK